MATTTTTNSLGDFLRAARIKAGFSQNELAAKLGYEAPQSISIWERGMGQPSADRYQKIVRTLKLNKTTFKAILLKNYERELNRTLN